MSDRMSEYMPERLTSRLYVRNYVRIMDQGGDHSKKEIWMGLLDQRAGYFPNERNPAKHTGQRASVHTLLTRPAAGLGPPGPTKSIASSKNLSGTIFFWMCIVTGLSPINSRGFLISGLYHGDYMRLPTSDPWDAQVTGGGSRSR